jgi:hypothetical protein
MSFSWFRRHQSLFLWLAVIFCVLVFATFSGFSDLEALVKGSGPGNTIGRFTVASSGNVVEVTRPDFMRTRNALNRFRQLSGNAEAITDDGVWQFLILRADATDAGISISEGEVAAFLQSWMGDAASKDNYRWLWRDQFQFASARECERFFSDMMLGARWSEVQSAAARIVDADDVYTRWSSDNMRFDLSAVIIPDTPLAEIASPPRDELQDWFDEQPEALRAYRFADPKKHDIVYAWLPLDADSELISDEALADTGEPTEQEIESRFNLLKPTRWPEVEAMDEEMSAEVRRELRIIRYVQQARDAFDLLEDGDAAAFSSHMDEAGLLTAETDEPVDAEALKLLDPIGDEVLPLWLDQLGEGQTHFGFPYRDQSTAYAVYIRGVVASRPLDFEEGYDKILDSWKEGERNAIALDWREAITTAARELPEAAEVVQPILDAAELELAERMEEQPDLDEEGVAALSKGIMDTADLDIGVRVAEFEHLIWDTLQLPDGATRVELAGVPRGYNRLLDGEEDAAGIERFLKTNANIYRMAVDGITQPLRHASSEQTAVVRVTGTSLPSMDEMWADEPGMDQSRRTLASQRQIAAQAAYGPEAIKVSHDLELIVLEDEGMAP